MRADFRRRLSPQDVAAAASAEPAFLRLPEPTRVFAARELRLRQLAAGHPMREHLLFAAELCCAQHEAALQSRPEVADEGVFRRAAERLEPPLPAGGVRAPSWRDDLRTVLRRLAPELAGSAKQLAMELAGSTERRLDDHADRLLGATTAGLDAAAPLIAAGLQVHFAALVAASAKAHAGLAGGAFGRIADAAICPCCGSRPVAALASPGLAGARYLHCTLCQTQWQFASGRCARCGSMQGLSYLSAQDGAGVDAACEAVQAECCVGCGHYLKQVTCASDGDAEPAADDLAAVELDRLAAQSGLTPHGINLLRAGGGMAAR